MKFSLFIEPRTSPDPRGHIRRAIDIARVAEATGYDKLWVAITHFRSLGFSVSGAFPLLTAISEATTTLKLGTAVVPLTYENAIRVVEDASFVDQISGGRVELGLGKGNTGKLSSGATLSSATHLAFEIDESEQERVYRQKLALLKNLIDPRQTISSRILASIYPRSEGLAERIWRASSRETEVVDIASNGDGFLLFRSGRAHANKQAQSDLIDLYRTNFSATLPRQKARTGLSRSILPAENAVEAYTSLIADRDYNPQYYRDFEPLHEEFQSASKEEFAQAYFDFMGTALGTPAEVAAALASDPAVRNADELLLNIPLSLENPAYENAVRLFIADVAPALALEFRQAAA
ncbi:LLM class flavin-dependent oxidoreductase [Rhizobium lusitanum]|uniref:LLM class flavin-dependent oxidoreductase n=1 Tax=Rhizobium lusitanum TaxID=293958 RepID=A0A6L9UL63_9HYPH|nr:LLM class flavin-dependent oxidoreductase [Rhizobium lusitanum]NEI74847.1 LLM class flavin-dependent oxidoreductase [Rhizobium lusitanum]